MISHEGVPTPIPEEELDSSKAEEDEAQDQTNDGDTVEQDEVTPDTTAAAEIELSEAEKELRELLDEAIEVLGELGITETDEMTSLRYKIRGLAGSSEETLKPVFNSYIQLAQPHVDQTARPANAPNKEAQIGFVVLPTILYASVGRFDEVDRIFREEVDLSGIDETTKQKITGVLNDLADITIEIEELLDS